MRRVACGSELTILAASLCASILILGSVATVDAQERNISVSILFDKECGINRYASLQMSTDGKQWAGGYADFNLPPGPHNLKVNVTRSDLIIKSIWYTDVINPRDQEFIVNAPNANVPITVSPGPTPSGRQARIQILMTCGEPEQRLPIIFLPGVAGSILEARDRELWPLAPYGDRADLALEPDGKTSATRASVVVRDVLRGRPKMNFYGGFIDSLKSMGYAENTDLFLFPYDWRQDNKLHFDRLDQVIDAALSKPGKKKVILAAHSMGGVIARGYVYSGSARAAKVDSIITIATPYWGAPLVYYGMINGYQFGNDSVRQELMKILMQNYPSGYQLLPQVPFITDSASGNMLSPEESNTIRYKWFTNVAYSFRDVYIPTEGNERFMNPGLLNMSKQFWSSVGSKERPMPLPGGVKQYSIIGYGISTLGGYKLEDWKSGFFSSSYLELGNRKVVLHPVSTDGDGTVPLWGLETSVATAAYYIPYKSGFFSDESTAHGDLPANKTVQSLVSQIVKHQNGLGLTLPVPAAFPRPAEYMGKPLTSGKELESLGTFELHSDAHLRISNGDKTLGYNNLGGIEETLPGTFLSMDEVEYASIADLNIPIKVTVTGIRVGKFTLDVKVKRAGSTIAEFSYREVPVKPETVAEVTMTLGQVPPAPPLSVTTDSRTITIPASIGSTSGGALPPTPTSGKACDWTGTWKVNQESFSFRQVVGLPHGQAPVTQVSGTGITDPSWRLTGTVQGNVLTGKWSNSRDSGSIRITMRSDCNSFSSSWGTGNNFNTFSGTGARVGNQGVVVLPQEVIPADLPELEEIPEDALELPQEATRQDSATGTLTTGSVHAPVLELVEVKQEPSCAIWPLSYKTCNSGEITTHDNSAYYKWTDPPKQIGREGFKLDLYVYAKAPARSRLVTGINVIPGGLEVDANPPRADVDSENGIEKENRLSVTVKPPSNPSGVYELRIGVTWGAGYVYRYRVVK